MNPMELTIQKMRELGFFQFILPFIMTSAIFYGALRKSKIFGEPDKNVTVNGIVALVAAFMVWSYPVIAGVNIETQLATFFTHGMIATVAIMLGLIVSSMFMPPDLPKFLSEKFKTGRMWTVILLVGILVGVIVLISSGLIGVFLPQGISLGDGGDSGEWLGVAIVLGGMLGSVALLVFVTK
jgi:hypothetical protein